MVQEPVLLVSRSRVLLDPDATEKARKLWAAKI
jgi:hypothetical protein